MAAERKTLSAQVDADSDLAREFEEFREERSMNSKSEAVRVLVRDSLEEHRDQSADGTQESSQDVVRERSEIDINLVTTDMLPALLGIGFLVGADGLMMSLQTVAGDVVGSMLFAIIGITLVALMMPLFVESIRGLFSGADSDVAPEADQ